MRALAFPEANVFKPSVLGPVPSHVSGVLVYTRWAVSQDDMAEIQRSGSLWVAEVRPSSEAPLRDFLVHAYCPFHRPNEQSTLGTPVEGLSTAEMLREICGRAGIVNAALLVGTRHLDGLRDPFISSRPPRDATRDEVIKWAADMRVLADDILDFAEEATTNVCADFQIHSEDIDAELTRRGYFEDDEETGDPV